jgi:hypothetical protein
MEQMRPRSPSSQHPGYYPADQSARSAAYGAGRGDLSGRGGSVRNTIDMLALAGTGDVAPSAIVQKALNIAPPPARYHGGTVAAAEPDWAYPQSPRSPRQFTPRGTPIDPYASGRQPSPNPQDVPFPQPLPQPLFNKASAVESVGSARSSPRRLPSPCEGDSSAYLSNYWGSFSQNSGQRMV